jgi:hypothetical protein
MTFNRLSSATVIVLIVAAVGLAIGAGSAYGQTSPYSGQPTPGQMNAQGFLQPWVYGPTPFLAPTSSQPSASFLTTQGNNDACQMSPSSYTYYNSSLYGPDPTYMYANYNGTTAYSGQPSAFSGWCTNMNVTASGANIGLDVNHPCWVHDGIGFYGDCDIAPVVGYSQAPVGSTGGLPTEEWFHLAGVFLAPGQYLDLADTTPWYTTHGHMAMVLPCESNGAPDVRLYQGIIDGGVFTMEASTMQYLQQLSTPGTSANPGGGDICVYHFDIGNVTDADQPYNPPGSSVSLTESANPFGVTDFALVNTSGHNVYFSKNFDRFTSTFSIANGFMDVIG